MAEPRKDLPEDVVPVSVALGEALQEIEEAYVNNPENHRAEKGGAV